MTGKPHGHETKNVKLPRNNCFVCGPDNPEGMRLVFTLDEQRNVFVCLFNLGDRYTGPPGHCHGGIIASILDDAMGKVNKLRQVVALTKEMTVEYLNPCRSTSRCGSRAGKSASTDASTSTWPKSPTSRVKSSPAAAVPSSPLTRRKCLANS